MILTIPDVPKSLNLILRMHWTKRRTYNKLWKWHVRSQIQYISDRVAVKTKVHIHQVRKKKLDKDNLFGSAKPIVDALRHWNILFDDSPEYLDLDVTQECGKPVRTIVEIGS